MSHCHSPHCQSDKTHHGQPHSHDHGHQQRNLLLILFSLLLFLLASLVNHFPNSLNYFHELNLNQKTQVVHTLYFLALLPVGIPILKEAWETLQEGEIFNEFLLMLIAVIGAIYIGEYPEAAAVMLFYAVGEYFQERAVGRANADIRSLVDLQPTTVLVYKNGKTISYNPNEVKIGEEIIVPAGGRVPLDCILLHEEAWFDTSTLTGESIPQHFNPGEEISAGMMTHEKSIHLSVLRPVGESALARIMQCVNEATRKKAPAENFIRKFARIYTPIVTLLAICIALFPPIFINGATWDDYIYRACIFLVVSCPCALVISIPLGYYSGIGAASSRGILFKGSSFLHKFSKVQHIVFDKTGTLTSGQFNIVGTEGNAEEGLPLAATLEKESTHPLAKAIVKTATSSFEKVEQLHETPGEGMTGYINGEHIAVGNNRLMKRLGIEYPISKLPKETSLVYISKNNTWITTIALADTPRSEAKKTLQRLRQLGISQIDILSGDRQDIVNRIHTTLQLDNTIGELQPQEKLQHIEQLCQQTSSPIAFVGDGINDAPALAASDIGIALAKTGSDIAIETADVVINNKSLMLLADALHISRLTQRIVILNIILALGVKAIVLILGAFGMAELWLAIFADTGVALLCVMNTFFIRLHRKRI